MHGSVSLHRTSLCDEVCIIRQVRVLDGTGSLNGRIADTGVGLTSCTDMRGVSNSGRMRKAAPPLQLLPGKNVKHKLCLVDLKMGWAKIAPTRRS